MKLQTYKMFVDEDTVYVERDDVLNLLGQELCKDYISREDAIMCMTGEYVADMTYKPEDIISKHIQRLKALPPVTPIKSKGHWIEERNDYGEITHWHCSNCYKDSGFITTCKWDYCPSCGSDNREVEE